MRLDALSETNGFSEESLTSRLTFGYAFPFAYTVLVSTWKYWNEVVQFHVCVSTAHPNTETGGGTVQPWVVTSSENPSKGRPISASW